MSAEASNATNGAASKSLAAMLEEQHTREDHHVTVEDVIDEEDLKHPPPSSLVNNNSSAPVAPVLDSTPAETATPSPISKPAVKKTPAFDVQSEELFPALGSGPKPSAPAAATWGAKKPSAAAAVAHGQPAKPMGKKIFQKAKNCI